MRQTKQAKALRDARAKLGVTSEGLADQLGVEVSTLNSWLLPKSSKAHRTMSKTATLLLARILAEAKRRK